MKTYTPEELIKILELHSLYLRGDQKGRRANLRSANLRSANLGFRSIVPETGSFRAYKKVSDGTILELEIIGARTSSYISRKCRVESARVIGAVGSAAGKEWRSVYDPKFVYRIGEIVSVPDFDSDPRIECTRGIHFFLTRAEAEAYS